MKIKLKELIDNSSLTRVEIAKRSNVSRQTIHAIETQKYCPSILLALRISKVLKVDVNKIFILEKEDL
jgi:putative transcriptional regulator